MFQNVEHETAQYNLTKVKPLKFPKCFRGTQPSIRPSIDHKTVSSSHNFHFRLFARSIYNLFCQSTFCACFLHHHSSKHLSKTITFFTINNLYHICNSLFSKKWSYLEMLVFFFFCKLFIVQQFNPCAIRPISRIEMLAIRCLCQELHIMTNKSFWRTFLRTQGKKKLHIKWFVRFGMCACVCAEGTSGLCNRQFFDNQFVLLILELASSCTQLLPLCRDQFRRSGIDSRHTRGHFQTCGSHYLVSLYSMICKF